MSLENIAFFQNQKEHVPNEFECLLDLLISSDYSKIVPKLILYYKLIEKLKQELIVTSSIDDIPNLSEIEDRFLSEIVHSSSKLIAEETTHPDS